MHTGTQTGLKSIAQWIAAGEDLIAAELLKTDGPAMENSLKNLMQDIWKEEEIPEDFKNSLVVPSYKGKGSHLTVTAASVF